MLNPARAIEPKGKYRREREREDNWSPIGPSFFLFFFILAAADSRFEFLFFYVPGEANSYAVGFAVSWKSPSQHVRMSMAFLSRKC